MAVNPQGGTGAQTIRNAEELCSRIKQEKELRDAIATIIAKLSRSNLSADEGKRHAEKLVAAYGFLRDYE
jgi:hypothetical protein